MGRRKDELKIQTSYDFSSVCKNKTIHLIPMYVLSYIQRAFQTSLSRLFTFSRYQHYCPGWHEEGKRKRQALGALYVEKPPWSSGGKRMESENSEAIENIQSMSFSELCFISSLNQLEMLSSLYPEPVKAGMQNHQSWKFPKVNFLLGPKRPISPLGVSELW